MKVKNEIYNRLTIVFFAFIFIAIVSFISILRIRFLKRNKYLRNEYAIRPDNIPAERGNIYDHNGKLLATTISKYEIRWDSQTQYINKLQNLDKYIDTIADGLSNILKDKTPEEWKAALQEARSKKNRDFLITKNVDYLVYEKIHDLPLFRKPWYKGGLKKTKKFDRKLIHGNLARRTIGFINSNDEFFGIERIENAELSGHDGIGIYKKLSGNKKELLSVYKEPINGDDVISTIDINMQDIVDKALRTQLKKLNADFGVAIVMEVKTGKIRAVANLKKVKSNYLETENLAATALYEPGSVMKLASFINAFEEDPSLTPDKKINTSYGIWKIGKNFAIKDYNYKKGIRGGFGIIPIQRVFELSSNTGTAKLIHSIFGSKSKNFIRRYSSFYFDKSLNLGFKMEPKPFFSKPGTKTWSGVSLRQMSLGYEILLTPYHIISFYNAIANDGKMMKPVFIEGVLKNGEITDTNQTDILNPSICSAQTLKYMKKMLEGVVENGTGKHHVKSNLVKIAGKSGTAQIYKKGKYVSDTTEYNTTFVGYFPADKPKYTCYVWINKPKIHKSGGSAAGPVVKEIAEQIYSFDYDLHKQNFIVNKFDIEDKTPPVHAGFLNPLLQNIRYLKIPFKYENGKWVRSVDMGNYILLKGIKVQKNAVPNVVGMNLSDALFLLENLGMNVKIKGEGHVIKQSLKPDTKILKNKTITLTLGV